MNKKLNLNLAHLIYSFQTWDYKTFVNEFLVLRYKTRTFESFDSDDYAIGKFKKWQNNFQSFICDLDFESRIVFCQAIENWFNQNHT